MRLIYHGHAAFSLISGDFHLIIDPFLSGNPLAKIKAEDCHPSHILLTHGHSDHLGDALELAAANQALIIAPTELANWCADKGAASHAMYMGSMTFPFGRCSMVQAFHGSYIKDNGQTLYGGLACGYVLEIGGKVVYHAGDTGIFGDMANLSRRARIDCALLPIGGNYTMDPIDALAAAAMIGAALTIPMHYNTFPIIRQDPHAFVAELGKQGLAGRVLGPEESVEL